MDYSRSFASLGKMQEEKVGSNDSLLSQWAESLDTLSDANVLLDSTVEEFALTTVPDSSLKLREDEEGKFFFTRAHLQSHPPVPLLTPGLTSRSLRTDTYPMIAIMCANAKLSRPAGRPTRRTRSAVSMKPSAVCRLEQEDRDTIYLSVNRKAPRH